MRIKDIEETFATISGEQLLENLVIYASMFLDMHQEDEDNIEAIIRPILSRLAETGIAQKLHGPSCRFMHGDDRCPCSVEGWAWPFKGAFKDPSSEGEPS